MKSKIQPYINYTGVAYFSLKILLSMYMPAKAI